jgi:hypothetical protein
MISVPGRSLSHCSPLPNGLTAAPGVQTLLVRPV